MSVRTFRLNRISDPTDVSGTGVVAHGALFPSGKVALSWDTQYRSVGVYDSMEQMEAIHCHHGATVVEWETFSSTPDKPIKLEPGNFYIYGDRIFNMTRNGSLIIEPIKPKSTR
jgi:hypothetical protein